MAHCHPDLAERFGLLCQDYEREQGRQLIVTCSWRSKPRQMELYQHGRQLLPASGGAFKWTVTEPSQVVTMIDGESMKSRHNVYPSEAIDVAVDIDPGPGKHVVWDAAAYEPLGELCTRHGLVWGGAWTRWQDRPHIELP